MLNKVILQGRLAEAPILKKTNSGKSVVSFSLAVERSEKDESGKRKTDFFNIVAWNGVAEMITKYFEKGEQIIIDGTLRQRNWKDQNGNSRYTTEVIASGVNFCGNKGKSAGGFAEDAGLTDMNDEDLPFY